MSVQWTAARSLTGLPEHDLRSITVAARASLSDLRNASILITGATGWFGAWLLDALCTADQTFDLKLQISAVSRDPAKFLDRFPDRALRTRVRWLEGDVRRLHLPQGDYSHIIHAAADNTLESGPDAAEHLFDTIVEGTRRAIAAAGASCRSILLVSSGAVYGPAASNNAGFSEANVGGPDPSQLQSVYAEAKRAAEVLGALAVARRTPVRIARCFAFVGPHMPFDRHFAIGNFIADAVYGRPIRIKGDGRATRSYLYMTDLVTALLTVLVKGVPGRAYNVGSDAAVTIEELARAVDQVVGGRGFVIEGRPSNHRDRYVPDTRRIRDELGFSPEVGLREAITRTADWYRSSVKEII